MTETKAIYGALLKVQKGLANIPKNGKMKFGATDYEYLKADDVQEKINPLLTENEIIVQPDFSVTTLMRGRGEGSPFVYVDLRLTYVAVTDGSEFTVRAFGESAATDDKSINKALTQAIKNAHRVTFQFASGEPEPDDMKPGMDSAEKKTPAQQKLDAARNDSAPTKLQDSASTKTMRGWVTSGGVPDTGTGEIIPLSALEITNVAKRVLGNDFDNGGNWKSDEKLSSVVRDAIADGARK